MSASKIVVWCNASFPPAADAELRRLLAGRAELIVPAGMSASNLVATGPDPLLEQADIAFGQPDPEQIQRTPRLKWVHLTSAGYTRYDRADIKSALKLRGAVLTNSSQVYAEPCAQHVFAMMLALARQLPQSLDDQRGSRPWQSALHRIHSRLIQDQEVLLLGFGAIGQRVAALLAPFSVRITAVRRSPAPSGSAVRVVPPDEVDALLPRADHVLNLLPSNPGTDGFVTADRLALMKPTAIFYNIGRGTTVDQGALVAALQSNRLAAAYLDVTDPEPLPPGHPLWSLPNCYITPHTAGGHDTEFHRLVTHFTDNFARFTAGQPLADRVV